MFSTRSSCSCLSSSSCSPNPPLTPSQPPTFTAPPTTKVHWNSLSHSPFCPCLPISNHDKPALFRCSCHCCHCCCKRQGVDGLRCSARLAGADCRRRPRRSPRSPSSSKLSSCCVCATIVWCVLGPSRLHNVLRHSSRSPEKTYLSCS